MNNEVVQVPVFGAAMMVVLGVVVAFVARFYLDGRLSRLEPFDRHLPPNKKSFEQASLHLFKPILVGARWFFWLGGLAFAALGSILLVAQAVRAVV